MIDIQDTPNPLSLKFLPQSSIITLGSKPSRTFFVKGDLCKESEFAKLILDIDGVQGVFLGQDFITITRVPNAHWQDITPLIVQYISSYIENGIPFLKEVPIIHTIDDGIVKQIKELIETRVRPAVAEDGGDIAFHSYEDGVVFLELYGACSGCPSSSLTLKSGIENLLKYYVPEVREVRQFGG